MAEAFALDMETGPVGPTGFGLASGTTGALLGVRFGGGVGFSSTNSGFSSGITSGGGGGGGSSSGGGVGCGGSGWVSSDISTVASGMSLRSIIFSAGRMAAIPTAAKCRAIAPPKAAMVCHFGAGRKSSGPLISGYRLGPRPAPALLLISNDSFINPEERI